jgi:2-methylcitrate dehydratase PrpD
MAIELYTTDGDCHTARVDYAKGDPLNPMSDDELCAKFRDVTAGIFSEDEATAVIGMCLAASAIEDVGELMHLVGG